MEISEINGVLTLTNVTASDLSPSGEFLIPASVRAIRGRVFQNRTGLTSIAMPSGVASIGRYAFSGCTNLTSMTISFGVTSIGNGVFSGCTNLSSITMPSGVTSIGDGVFSYCTSLTSMTIPSGVTSIGERTFWGCTGLTSIIIPSSVTLIGAHVFYGCSNLTQILINTDTPEEFERIKELLPVNVRAKAIINPVLLKAKQIRHQLLVDFSATMHPVVKRLSSSLLCNDIVKEIFSYDDFTDELTIAPVLSLKKALEQEPFTGSEDCLAAYKATLESIKCEHVFWAQCDRLASSLQRYNDITNKGLPSQSSGFFAGKQTSSNANNVAIRATYNLVERLIDSLRRHTAPVLSLAEQDTLSSRPHLLAKIPQGMKERLGFDVEPTYRMLPAATL